MSQTKAKSAANGGKRADGSVRIAGVAKNHKNGHKKRKHRILPFVFLSLLILAIAAFTFIKMTVRPPEITPVPTPTQPQQPNEPDPTPGKNDEAPDDQIDVEPTNPGLVRKDDFYTFLIVGTDKAGANTDVLMVASFDTANNQVNVINIPRDTLVNVSRKVKKINAAYSVGGMDNLMEEVKSLIGFKPDFYMLVDLKGFVNLVDAIGGVDFNVPVNMDYDDPTQDLSIHFEKGLQHLDGQAALEVVRFRHNNAGSKYGPGYARQDLDRIQTTQKLLTAVAKKMVSPQALPQTLLKINDLVEIAEENLDTNLKFGEMLWLAKEALGVDTAEELHFYTLAEDSAMYKGLSYVFVDEEKALELINSTINPYTTDIEDLDVIHP